MALISIGLFKNFEGKIFVAFVRSWMLFDTVSTNWFRVVFGFRSIFPRTRIRIMGFITMDSFTA